MSRWTYRDYVDDVAARVVYDKAHVMKSYEERYYPEGTFKNWFPFGIDLAIDHRRWFQDVDFTQYDNGQRNLTPDGFIVARDMIAPLVEDEIDKIFADLEREYKEEGKSKYVKNKLDQLIAWKEGKITL